jgi:serine/threonine-protein kinase HipA
LSDVRQVERAIVYRGMEIAGEIRRTDSGTIFEYERGFLNRHQRREMGIAVHLPFAHESARLGGGAVHPFFANLLPEGLRLTALKNRVKTSLDDELSLLLAAGQDPVGDICVVQEGEAPWSSNPTIDVLQPELSNFRAAFQASVSEEPGEIAEPSFAGVQDKISGSMVSFPVRGRGIRKDYILKLNPGGRESLVANELFFMRMASACGIEAAAVSIIQDSKNEPGLLVERFDRVYDKGAGEPYRVHVEDGCQLLNLHPARKYTVSTRQLFQAVLDHVDAPMVEGLRLLRIFAFSYLIGNGDLHAKNVSVQRSATGRWSLAPAYDLLSTLPYGDRKMALSFEGKDENLRRNGFIEFGKAFSIPERATSEMLDKLLRKTEPWISRVPEIGLTGKVRDHLKSAIVQRRQHLS